MLILDPATWRPHDEGGARSYSVAETESFLHWLTARRFLLHGSPRAIAGHLEPRRAYEPNRGLLPQPTVYLTEAAVLAIFCALVDNSFGAKRGSDIVWARSNREVRYERVRLVIEREDQVRSHGYVYVVLREAADEEKNGEFLCYRKVRPSLVIRVDRSDLRYPIEIG